MAIKSPSRTDRELNRFVESPTRPGQPAVEVVFGESVSNHKNINGAVTTAGTPIIITPPFGLIKSFIIQNPSRGPNKNDKKDVLLVSLDGADYISVSKGASYFIEGLSIASFKLDSNNNGVNYEIVLGYL